MSSSWQKLISKINLLFVSDATIIGDPFMLISDCEHKTFEWMNEPNRLNELYIQCVYWIFCGIHREHTIDKLFYYSSLIQCLFELLRLAIIILMKIISSSSVQKSGKYILILFCNIPQLGWNMVEYSPKKEVASINIFKFRKCCIPNGIIYKYYNEMFLNF